MVQGRRRGRRTVRPEWRGAREEISHTGASEGDLEWCKGGDQSDRSGGREEIKRSGEKLETGRKEADRVPPL